MMKNNGKCVLERALAANYRPCVGVVVFNKEGLVFSGKRLLKRPVTEEEKQTLWQFPQGGIEIGETPLQAAQRELYEETGMRHVTFLAEHPTWLCYEFPPSLKKTDFTTRYRGQVQKWFAFLFTGDEKEICTNPPPLGNETEFETWQWRSLEEMPNLVIDFKREIYKTVVDSFTNLSLKFTTDALH